MGGGVGFVDSARGKTKARAVVEIYLEQGVTPTPGFHPFELELELIQSHMAQKPMLRGEVHPLDTTRTKVESMDGN